MVGPACFDHCASSSTPSTHQTLHQCTNTAWHWALRAVSLQVVAGERRSTREESRVLMLGGIPVSPRFTWAMQMVITCAIAPEASFPGGQATHTYCHT